jgi:glycosyltransferase involved in cell wall biosynthesis
MTSYKISVIMPSLNEQDNLALAVKNVIDCFESLNISGQIVIVNDGSTDRTAEIASSLAEEYPFLKVLHHNRPQGIGASFWDGMRAGDGEIVTMLPGDGENDSCEILRYLPLLEHVDLVVPFIYNKAIRSLKRRMLSSLYRGIVNISFGLTLNYMNGTVMYRKAVFDSISLKCTGFFYQTELLVKCLKAGYLHAEVPSSLRERGKGVSKATTVRSLWRVALDYGSTLRAFYFDAHERKPLSPETVTALRWKEIGRAR